MEVSPLQQATKPPPSATLHSPIMLPNVDSNRVTLSPIPVPQALYLPPSVAEQDDSDFEAAEYGEEAPDLGLDTFVWNNVCMGLNITPQGA